MSTTLRNSKLVLRLIGMVGVLWCGLAQAPSVSADEPRLSHAYYLFRAGSFEGCADCYIPLLLTSTPLPDATAAPQLDAPDTLDVYLMVTYERDSIWEIPANPHRVSGQEIEADSRMIRVDGVRYRYQEVPVQEAIRLLKKPLGTIPISRPLLPDRPTDEKIQWFLKRLPVQ